MAMVSPFVQVRSGFRSFLLGLGWLRRHPLHFAVLLLPMILGLVFLVSTWTWLFTHGKELVSHLLFAKADEWYWVIFYYICQFLLYVVFLGASLLCSVLLVNVLACPIYEWVSVSVEREITGKKSELSFFKSILMIWEELKKITFVIAVSLMILFIPGLNIFGLILTAVFVAWDVYDYPLARRGMSFRDRLKVVFWNFWSLLGLGCWLMIPFVQFIILPLSVPGGTILALEDLKAYRS